MAGIRGPFGTRRSSHIGHCRRSYRRLSRARIRRGGRTRSGLECTRSLELSGPALSILTLHPTIQIFDFRRLSVACHGPLTH
jgi:hypothetical protein